jgi:hypothetical protein
MILVIGPGRHTYNFSLEVDPNTPSSIEEKKGCIKYKIGVNFDAINENGFGHETDIKIIRPIDLIRNAWLRSPCEKEIFQEYCTLCFCFNKPLHFIVKMYETGSIPGKNLSVEAKVKNPTSVEILHLKYSLVKRVIFESETPYNKTFQEDTVVYEGINGTPMSNRERDYIIKFRVPAELPATTFNDNFPLIKVKYFLIVMARVSLSLLTLFY